MEILVKNEIEYKKDEGTLIIPYLNEDELRDWFFELSKFQEKKGIELQTLLRSKGEWMFIILGEDEIRLLLYPLKEGAGTLEEQVREGFLKLGNKLHTSCQIVLDALGNIMEKEHIAELIARSLTEGCYAFSARGFKDYHAEQSFKERELLTDEKKDIQTIFVTKSAVKEDLLRGGRMGRCINRSRSLSNLPNNFLHVAQLSAYARGLAETYQMELTVLGEDQLRELCCGGICSVNQGADAEPKLILLKYQGANKNLPYKALAGKGVMFDTGGYHLKSIDGMEGMKYDMCGAANVMAVMEILAQEKSKVNVMAVIPAVENVIGHTSLKMGDVITTMSGKTVEVYNTDAEGRLILCDALTYAAENKAEEIIDLATLTYSCQAALGNQISGIFSNQDEVLECFTQTVRETGEKVWRLPLDMVYHEKIRETSYADLINYAPSYGAGASIAACFLEEFIPEGLPWIHLDVVGTATRKKANEFGAPGATGVLIAAIARYLMKQRKE